MPDAFITQTFIRTLCEDIRSGETVRRKLPVWGRVYIDPKRPFLCVYRRPPRRRDPGTPRLVTTQASYLLVPGDPAFHEAVQDLIEAVTAEMVKQYGGFFLLELWSTPDKGEAEESDPRTLQPAFHLTTPKAYAKHEAMARLARSLKRTKIHDQIAEVNLSCAAEPAPPRAPSLLTERLDTGCLRVGLEVAPFYRDADTGAVYPFLFDDLRRQMAEAFKHAFFTFTRQQTRLEPPHFHTMGRGSLDKITREVDKQLAQIDASFGFLLQITPVNTREAWEAFEASGFENEPTFLYRPLPVDPELLKRTLFDVPTERVEDPVLGWIFREKQEELDRRITMLRDRGTRRFFFGSLQLFGEVEPGLLDLAEEILDRLPDHEEDYTTPAYFTAAEFADVAEQEFDHYRTDCAIFPDKAQHRSDMPAGLMVSSGQLLIGEGTKVPASRVNALIQHEVGTHMVTYYNGDAQPLQLLCTGLAGYDALQEGLAVLSEYLVDGLTLARLRILAARVVASHSLIEGASFVEVFRQLCEVYDFGEKTAYTITMRTFRGGGLIKDVIYLRGLRELTDYLRDGGELEPLYVGKIALHHVPLIQELEQRGILRPALLRPRCLDYPSMPANLERVRSGLTLIDFFEEHIA